MTKNLQNFLYSNSFFFLRVVVKVESSHCARGIISLELKVSQSCHFLGTSQSGAKGILSNVDEPLLCFAWKGAL